MENEKSVMHCNNAQLADFIDPSGGLREAGLLVEKAQVYGRDSWGDFIAAKETGAILEITEDVFDYFLEVLPPIYMKGASFGFAEGAEPITDFWAKGDHFFCQLSTRMNHC